MRDAIGIKLCLIGTFIKLRCQIADLESLTTYHITSFSPAAEKEQQFVIAPYQDLRRPQPMVWPHTHSFYEIIWIKSARSGYQIDQHQVNLHSDTIYFMSPGQAHSIEQHETVKGHCIMFTDEFFIVNLSDKESLGRLSFLENSYETPFIQLSTEAQQQLQPLVELMYQEFERPEHSKTILCSLLYVFLCRLERVYQSPAHALVLPAHAELVRQFKKLIDIHFKEQQPLSFYASRLFVTEQQLNENTKRATGKTAGQLVRDRLMVEAKRLLVHSNFSIGEISDRLGFNDFSYFSRQFKKQHLLSPEQYRNQNRLK